MRRHLLIAAGRLAHHVRKRHAAALLTPGNIPGLVPGSPAAATPLTQETFPALLLDLQQLLHGGLHELPLH